MRFKILDEDMWQSRYVEQTKEIFHFDCFQDFVEAPPPDGLNTTVTTLKRLCGNKQTDVRDLIDKALQQGPGGNNNPLGLGGKSEKKIDNLYDIQVVNNNQKEKFPSGTSKESGLRKLRKYAQNNPKVEQLRQLVLVGKMSINKALIKAGLRKKT